MINHQLQSENIGDLIVAMIKARSKIGVVAYNKKNPHFKSSYADYTSIVEECMDPLLENGLMVTHQPTVSDGKRILITQISHTSGQWMRSYLLIPQEKETPQSMVGSITYSKRVALSAFIAIACGEDDDGEEAEKPYREDVKLSAAQAKEIEELANDPDLIDRIIKAYKATNLMAIKASEYSTIIKRIQITKEKSNEKTGS